MILTLLGLICLVSPSWALSSEQGIKGWLEKTFPAAEAQVAATHGLTPYQQKTGVQGDTHRNVILIHGLDEPGRVWLNLAPALAEKGFSVWQFTYPNDQDIRASSRFLFQCLGAAGWLPSDPVALVCHSMGGLVARQMLTDPEIGYAGAADRARVPQISHLIMIGTPNHGAGLARFRVVMEVREQILNRIHGYGHWLQGVYDGDGAAAAQLLPDSEFLNRLNARPHPEKVSMAVIAGILSPWLPPGDGLVSLSSARLDTLALYTVPGNHLSMVRNMTASSKRVPPAVPLVIRLLAP
jgi:pimeloyl-ACP methyl ester carboxylesterase